jgi:hypothetical protein
VRVLVILLGCWLLSVAGIVSWGFVSFAVAHFAIKYW